MELQFIQDMFTGSAIGIAVKAFQLITVGLFIIFSLLSIRQVGMMNHTIQNTLHFEIRVLAYFQFFLGIGVFLAILFL